MTQPCVQLASIDEQKSFNQQKQQEIEICMASHTHSKPCPHLLNGSRKDHIQIVIPLYEALVKGEWNAAKEIIDKRPELVKNSFTRNGETGASSKSIKQVEEFMEHLMIYMEKKDLELQDSSSNTALYIVAATGNIKMVRIMVEKNRSLMTIPGNQKMKPLCMAALFGHYDVVKYLYDNSQKLRADNWTSKDLSWLLLRCVKTDKFDIALKTVKEHSELSSSGSVLGVLARKTDAFAVTESNFITRTINCVIHPKMHDLEKERKVKALELLTIIWESIVKKPKREINDILEGPPDTINQDHDKEELKVTSHDINVKTYFETNNIIKEPAANWKDPRILLPGKSNKKYSSRIVFVAAEMGNTRFIVELMRLYPSMIWKVNDNNESIFHVAVLHRQAGIYNLSHKIENKKLITHLKDRNGNNMLHLVGKSVKRERIENLLGGVFHMRQELLRFKEVEEMIPSHELFTKEHEDVVKQGEKWMKRTASQCMVVVVLIVTIIFAAAFTVPDGYKQSYGIPYFYRKTIFVVFVVTDAMSLFSSSASMLTFLSLLTSRYDERDFLESLPKKLMLGLITLYFLITTMMIAFSVRFLVLYHNNLKWIPILVTLFATMPVLLFGMLKYHLLKDVIYLTFASTYLFWPKKKTCY